MIITVDTQKLDDPNIFGETLREYCFVGDGFGCYSTFELLPEFYKINDAKQKKDFIDRLCKEWYGTSYNYEPENEEKDSLSKNLYTNGNIIITWYWDGDGTLIIAEKNKIAVNGDCKKDYGWYWLY